MNRRNLFNFIRRDDLIVPAPEPEPEPLIDTKHSRRFFFGIFAAAVVVPKLVAPVYPDLTDSIGIRFVKTYSPLTDSFSLSRMDVLYGFSCKPEFMFYSGDQWPESALAARAADPSIGFKFHKNAFHLPWPDDAERVTA